MTDLVERFITAAKRRPDAPAVTDRGRTYTYGEMYRLVQKLASDVSSAARHPRVLVLLEQGYQAYAAKLAALLAGGYYAPVNVEAPAAKIRQVAQQFKADAIITRHTFANLLPESDPRPHVVDIEFADKSPDLQFEQRPVHELAYVMFTSGTTGEPKGVMIPRTAINHYVDWILDVVAPTPDDRWSQHPIIAFDLSQFDIYGALCSGGHLFPFNTPKDRMFPALAVRQYGVTIWNSVPSVISQMSRANHMTSQNLSTIRLMNFCGEALLSNHVDEIFSACPDVSVHNTYGPTEATVSCTLIRLDRNNYRQHCKASVAIGDPIPGSNIHLVGGPNADEGEIAITGVQLACGYWMDDAKTAGAFRQIEYLGHAERAYFTGDYARREGDDIYFAGRLDFQVKIRGRRLELLEIDSALRKCGFAHAATALIGEELHAFLETDLLSIDVTQLRNALSAHIEQHAIPTQFHLRKSLSRNANDKIDVNALIASVKAA